MPVTLLTWRRCRCQDEADAQKNEQADIKHWDQKIQQRITDWSEQKGARAKMAVAIRYRRKISIVKLKALKAKVPELKRQVRKRFEPPMMDRDP